MKILVTGAGGFVGSALADHLSSQGRDLVLCARGFDTCNRYVKSPDLSGEADWSTALQRVSCVIHVAGLAHVINGASTLDISEFRRVNFEGTLGLARQAVGLGVKKFIFISSIGVNGSHTVTAPFCERSIPAPHADYALSKFEAEQGLLELAQGSGMELVIIRPPLVYAGHAPGNFQRLLKFVSAGLPLPFGSVRNKRSLIALDNLIDFIALCIDHPAAANELFLISDGVDISTPEMIRYMASGMGKKANLLSVSESLMRYSAKLLGKENIYTQLCGSLVIDSSKAKNLLGWKPMLSPEQGLDKAGEDYKQLLLSST